MSDPTLLVAGMFCFSLTLIGVIMTIQEMKKSSDKHQ